MSKKICVLLLALLSFCAAANKATLAYKPFLTEGLYKTEYTTSTTMYSYAPSTVYYNGMFHQFYCSNGHNSDNYFNPERNSNLYTSWDHVRYRTSKDGSNWSAPRIVMTVNKNAAETCACDPSVVYGDDGYWYMLYDGNIPGNGTSSNPRYGTVVYLARSYLIQGPYFKYLGNGKWENEVSNPGNPKVMLKGPATKTGYGVGQQTVVKGVGENFYVWLRNSENNFKFIHVNNLTQLDYANAQNVYYRKKGSSTWIPFNGEYDIGDVRYNVSEGHNHWELWAVKGCLVQKTVVTKFKSTDGIHWEIENENEIGSYNFIHNIGVSGDARGWIWNNRYLVSFSGPFPGTDDAAVALYKTESQLKSYGYDFEKMRAPDTETPLLGLWPMWQQLVGATWSMKSVKFSAAGFNFPNNVNSTKVDYFTGDYDGDGVTDLGAVDRSTGKWYVYSSAGRYYIYNGRKFISNMNDSYEVVAGDYDGDGKTDIGAVNKATGQWYIHSSLTDQDGINQYSPSSPNYIPWGWKWSGMTSSHKIVVGDFDGDGKTDRAIYKAPNWYIISSAVTAENVANGLYSMYGFYIPWGWNWTGMQGSHVAVSGDFDGDGITDRAIYGTKDAKWFVLTSRLHETPLTWYRNCDVLAGCFEQNLMWGFVFNASYKNTNPYVGDYDGDGVSDLVQVNTSTGQWSIYRSLDGKTNRFDDGNPLQWDRLKNATTPVILVGDFDGDGKADRAFADKQNRMFYVISSKNKKEGVSVEIKFVPKDVGSGYFAKERFDEDQRPSPETFTQNHSLIGVSVVNRNVSVVNVQNGDKIAVFNMLGKKVYSSVSNGNPVNFVLPSYGKYVVRAGNASKTIVAK